MTAAYFLKMRTTKKPVIARLFKRLGCGTWCAENIAENSLRTRGTHAFHAALPIARRYFHANSAARKRIQATFTPILLHYII